LVTGAGQWQRRSRIRRACKSSEHKLSKTDFHRAATESLVAVFAFVQYEMQIPPLRCGMTKQSCGNDKGGCGTTREAAEGQKKLWQ
jgi:hypothetical protein